MKKLALIFSLTLACYSALQAQSSFQTLFNSTDEEGQSGNMTEISGLIVNNNCCATTKYIQYVTSWEMPSDWFWSHCTPDMCLPTGDSLGFYYLMPADTGEVSFRFYVGNNPGSGEMVVRFADRDNLSDYQDIQFTVWAGLIDLEEVAWKVLVYPNPVENTIFLQGDTKDISCQLFDIMGKRIKGLAFNNKKIDVSKVKTGVYFLVLQKAEHRIVKRLLIQ